MEWLAFRIYGNFLWPPVAAAVIDETTAEQGQVDISYVKEDEALVACVRWMPRFPATTDQPELRSILEFADSELLEKVRDPSKPFAFRLDDKPIFEGAKHWGRRLVFRGAVLFDQFDVAGEADTAATPKLNLRWLLARRFNQGAIPFLSEVVIGHVRDGQAATRGTTFGFNLALPTPAPQGVIEHVSNYALPFRTRYLPHLDQASKKVPVNMFAAGPENGLASDREVDFATAWGSGPGLKERHLGGFGFSRTDGGTDYLFFPRRAPRPTELYWLEDKRRIIDEVLSKLGAMSDRLRIAIRMAKEANPSGDNTPGDEGERWNSVGFIVDPERSAKTMINFRTAIFTVDDKLVSEGDLGLYDPTGQSSQRYFMIRDPSDGSRWIKSEASHLLFDLELEYEISDDQIWRVVEDRLAAEVALRVRIGFMGKLSGRVGEGELDANPSSDERIGPAQLLAPAIKGMRLARLDLQNIESGQPQSLLPEFVKFERVGDGHPRFAYCATVPARLRSGKFRQAAGADRLEWAEKEPGRTSWPGAAFRFTLWPHEGLRNIDGRPVSVRATIRLPSFAYQDAGADAAEFTVTLWHDRDAYNRRAHYQFGFRLRKGGGGAVTGRLGGLEFESEPGVLFGPQPDPRPTDEDDNDFSYWRFGPRPRIAGYWTANVDVRLRIAATSVEPRGVDLGWGDRTGRPRPLLIRLDRAGQLGGKYILDATERLSGASDRQLIATIFDLEPSGAHTSQYMVLSERPFSIIKFQSQPLQVRGSDENAQVAFYDSDTRHWQLKLVAPTYHYEFPPQSVGESIDKPRRLEIHDPVEGQGDDGQVIPPALTTTNGIERMHAVEFRLTPSAELWIRPSDVERGYFLPEWASGEIFQQSGAFGLGAALAAFRGEFIYGLTVGVDTARETGPARGARVAEIGALLGRPPGEIRASVADDALARRWAATSAAIARRPERLEMWMREPDSNVPFAPARFAAGVQFALRDSAVHNFPVKDDERLNPVELETRKDGPRLRRHGLRGGAIWPLESANVCRALLNTPQSSGGTIERIALSPSGGDADQRAEFLNGLLAIISETRNGHVQRHRVEILGRITAYWHRAKHVVVYERTANPSAQFTPEGGIGTRTRRPVLRKVSEYVELLQPVRNYPDFAVASPESSAGLRSVRFNSRIINVDSAWSKEVGDFGWKVPLWNRRAAKMRPTVYPRPDIVWVTAAEGEGADPVAAQDTPEPDKLYFFTDLSAGTPETDRWFSRIGIDCTNMPPPKHKHQPELGGEAEEKRRPSVPRIPRGHSRFTLRLNPAGRRSVINAGRGDEPIYGGLESITFMRSNAVDSEDPSTPPSKQTVDVVAALDKARGRLAEVPEQSFAKIAGALSAFQAAAGGIDENAILARARELREELRRPTAANWSYAEKLGALHEIAKEGRSRCEKLVDDFAGSLHRKKLLILDHIRSWETNAVDHFPELEDWTEGRITNKGELIDAIAAKVMTLIAPALEEVQADVGNVENSVEQARAMVRDFQVEMTSILEKASRKLDEVEASYDFEKPWSPHRLDEYHRRIASVRDGVVGDIESAAMEIQSRLATELDGLSHLIATEVGARLRSVSAGESGLRSKLGAAEGAAAAYVRTVETQLKTISPHLDALEEKLDQAITQAPNHAALLGDLKARLAQLRTLVAALSRDLAGLAGRLGSAADQIEKGIGEAAGTLRSLLGSVKQFADDAIAGFGTITEGGLQQLKQELVNLTDAVAAVPGALIAEAAKMGERPDWMVKRLRGQLDDALAEAGIVGDNAFDLIDSQADVIDDKLTDLKEKLADTEVEGMLKEHVLCPAVEQMLAAVNFADYQDITEAKLDELRRFMRDMSGLVEQYLDELDRRAAEFFKGISDEARKACGLLKASLQDAFDALGPKAQALIDRLGPLAQQIQDALDDAANAVELLKGMAEDLDRDVKAIGEGLSDSYAAAQAYADRVFEAAGSITSGGLAAAPGNILRAWAAVTSAPALPGLELARDRIACYYDQLKKYVDTTPVEAWFGRLGDELKAMGLSLPFSRIGDGLIPDDLSKLDIGRVFKNFGGIDLSKLFGGYKLPAGAKDAIRISHAFDKKQFRTWVQIDIDLPLPGRKALFTLGPFKLDFVDSRLVGVLRLEASKDSQEVEQTGRASFHTDIDAVVSGQSMVRLQKVVLNYERGSGLKVDFDPKNIRLNPAFRFIQETLASLFPDELGGLKVIKKDGIPIGVEHEFSMPPLSLMAGTSGVSNIQISNRFALIAYPDFVISDRFSLSRPEMPFLFSIFIIGGTGYINVDCEYRPFKSRLTVVVEAAAGGSAALGFSAGPVSGAVFITLSIALSYRKVIGSPGGGLTASLVLVIAGNVDVAGIATVYIGLLLRMSYRENGDIDGVGTLTVTVEISRWFKIKVRRNVQYQLRKGKSQTSSSTEVSTSISDANLDKARQMLAARG